MTEQQLGTEALVDHCTRQPLTVKPDTLLAPLGHYPKHTTAAGAKNKRYLQTESVPLRHLQYTVH